jgi:hypothetical protein
MVYVGEKRSRKQLAKHVLLTERPTACETIRRQKLHDASKSPAAAGEMQMATEPQFELRTP